MLSDSLFDLQQQLKRDISHYSEEPFEADYPNSQKTNIILALYHLQLAQMAFDSFEHPDNHVWGIKTKRIEKARATKEFEKAVNKTK